MHFHALQYIFLYWMLRVQKLAAIRIKYWKLYFGNKKTILYKNIHVSEPAQLDQDVPRCLVGNKPDRKYFYHNKEQQNVTLLVNHKLETRSVCYVGLRSFCAIMTHYSCSLFNIRIIPWRLIMAVSSSHL